MSANLEADMKTLWECVTAQGQFCTKAEESLARIVKGVNNQANGLRQAEARITQLEMMLVKVLGARGLPAGQQAPVTRYAPRPQQRQAVSMRTVNPLPQLTDGLDDENESDEEDGDFEYETNQ